PPHVDPRTSGFLSHDGCGHLAEAMPIPSAFLSDDTGWSLTLANLLLEPDTVETARDSLSLSFAKPLCKLYIWGYGLFEAASPLDRFVETEDARRFAAERGWMEARPGAWAKECTFAMALYT